MLKEGGKYDPHDYSYDYPPPYIPRRYTFEIDERIDAQGNVVRALDRQQARDVVRTLKEREFEAVAVSLMWSIANSAHEKAIARLLDEELPGVPYTLSHELIPIVREYRRASTTAIDASLKPLMQQHLREMESDLREAGFRGELLIGTSAGGCQHVSEVAGRPVQMLKSGPAMAPVAGQAYITIESLGGDAIVCDTGGTTFDVGLVRDGNLVYTRDSWLGRRWLGHMVAMSTRRRAQHRRRRRLDRLDRCRRPAARRAAERGRGAGPGLLRPRRRCADRDRRLRGARLVRSRLFQRRPHDARCRGRAAGDRDSSRASSGAACRPPRSR